MHTHVIARDPQRRPHEGYILPANWEELVADAGEELENWTAFDAADLECEDMVRGEDRTFGFNVTHLTWDPAHQDLCDAVRANGFVMEHPAAGDQTVIPTRRA